MKDRVNRYLLSRNQLHLLVGLLLFWVLLLPDPALAHETITAGPYTIEYGWLNEPPVAGQPNAVVINISGDELSSADIADLNVEVVYGGETKTLSLQPLAEDTPGQFIGPLTPTRPGQYSLRLSGKIGATDVSAEVQPEEVQSPEVVEFPRLNGNQGQGGAFGLTAWLAVAGLIAGLAGMIVGLIALFRKA